MVENVENPKAVVSLTVPSEHQRQGHTSRGRRFEDGRQDKKVDLGIASTFPDLFPFHFDARGRFSRLVLHQTSVCDDLLLGFSVSAAFWTTRNLLTSGVNQRAVFGKHKEKKRTHPQRNDKLPRNTRLVSVMSIFVHIGSFVQ